MAPSSLCGRGGPSSRTACRWGGSSTISTKGRWRRRSGREGRWVDGGPASSYLHAMALLPIIETPDPRLRVISKPVETFDAELKTPVRSEKNTSELQSLMRISYPVFYLKKKRNTST